MRKQSRRANREQIKEQRREKKTRKGIAQIFAIDR
jgi:hypothetical protein